MSEIDWKHLCDLSSQENAALRAALEKARGEAQRQYDENVNRIAKEGAAIAERDSARADCDHWAADYTELQVTLGRYIAERDSARALLRGALNGLPTYGWMDLRARIAKELGQ